MTITQTQQIQP